jgi:protein SCO1/2
MASAKTLRVALWGMVALVAAIVGLIALNGARQQSGNFALANFGAPFKLASTKGGELDSTTLKGKPYGVFFGFTHCPEVCPTTLFEMSATLKELGDQATDFRLIFITVDPERDTVANVKDYLANFDPRIEGVVPSMEQLPEVARAYHVYYKKQPTSDGSYTMDHTATLFLVDAQGNLKSTLSFDETRDTRVEKMKKLLGAG